MNRECERIQAQLSALLDGELTAEEAAGCHQHLDGCAECSRRYQELAAARELLRATPDPEPPDGLLSAIRAEAAMELRRPATIFQRFQTPVLVAAAAAAAVLAITVLPRVMQPQTSPQIVAEPPDSGGAVEVAERPHDVSAAEEATREPEAPSPAPAAAALALVPPAGVAGGRRSGARPMSAAERPPEAAEAPRVAYADTGPEAMHLDAAGPVAPRGETAAVFGAAPRTTRGGVEIGPLPADGASRMETEVATGVVAGAVVEKFVAENLLESQPTALAVVTDTPTAEIGPVLVDEGRETSGFALCFTQSMLALSADTPGTAETSGFGLCFTQSMGRALAEAGN
ncbi:MAG: zf-HC2 domain-containing protein [Armatimonadota bacterium]|nr:zf-HC2 domain-containing protein [Armatimonadota bacterium]